MKSYILSIGIALLAISMTVITSSFISPSTAKVGVSCCKDASCCKNCNDVECKATCKKMGEMTEAELKTEKGKALAAKCKVLCEKNKCCTSAENGAVKCKKKGKKSCCKH
jgi:hypothetical protein